MDRPLPTIPRPAAPTLLQLRDRSSIHHIKYSTHGPCAGAGSGHSAATSRSGRGRGPWAVGSTFSWNRWQECCGDGVSGQCVRVWGGGVSCLYVVGLRVISLGVVPLLTLHNSSRERLEWRPPFIATDHIPHTTHAHTKARARLAGSKQRHAAARTRMAPPTRKLRGSETKRALALAPPFLPPLFLLPPAAAFFGACSGWW
jgi:hypothetical protein